jgi:DNA-directed RNA polymerase specialized sigma24 family protein
VATRVLEVSPRLRSIVTRRSLLPPPADRQDAAFEKSWRHLVTTYTPAMRRYVASLLHRLGGRSPDAGEVEDVVQEYLATCLEKGWLAREGPALRSFRAYVTTQLRRFVLDHLDRRNALRRGAARQAGPTALETAAASGPDPADALDRGWVEVAVSRALASLREGNADYAEVIDDLLRTHGEGSPDLAARMGRPAATLAVLRHRARRRFALLFEEELRFTVRDEADFAELWSALARHLP